MGKKEQNTRQVARLRKLAEMILIHPDYDQTDFRNCIIGLGNRMTVQGNFISKESFDKKYPFTGVGSREPFAKKFGVSLETAQNLLIGDFQAINPKSKVNVFTQLEGANMRRAANAILNHIAYAKEIGLTI